MSISTVYLAFAGIILFICIIGELDNWYIDRDDEE